MRQTNATAGKWGQEGADRGERRGRVTQKVRNETLNENEERESKVKRDTDRDI